MIPPLFQMSGKPYNRPFAPSIVKKSRSFGGAKLDWPVFMDKQSRIYVAGHGGLVGSALLRKLDEGKYSDVITKTHEELDLTDRFAVEGFFARERPEYVFLAAALVGGIEANRLLPAEFIQTNLMIQTSVIHAAYLTGVKRLIFFGSNCAYPRQCPQPMREEYLLTGRPEPTSLPYALAKLAGMAMCESYSRQHGVLFFSVIPATLYGPGDDFNPDTSHVLSALIHKFHEAGEEGMKSVAVWGTGRPRREFLYVDDLADACVDLMRMDESRLRSVLISSGFILNAGSGEEVSVLDLAHLVRGETGSSADIDFDSSKPDGSPRRLLDSQVLRSLGWSARIPLQGGIRKTYDWYKKSRRRIKDRVG